ncbi:MULTISPECIES: hypothetical protein [unclassified Microbacterium]|uniref:hypothetical protein n=1 Tax=unclassified Microbacterium TaxID=2609290 RepID=UPI00246999E8|nr:MULTISPECIES: hypothetical protein [unclassified Microbacterium]MDH5131896.1 hypothetical protein [Microbacterium sp. RD10]MDH5135841.1 hypothetical protein [Microbacterium sp. RD11]MDH5146368.1 hypothetical protein [Microbacterium sp. RD12]MDH5154128.1 hypothetical protein [Microbacterium sp. RD06]MDH5165836.1 hypothetical protein [Microbacterium sp. RD02]
MSYEDYEAALEDLEADSKVWSDLSTTYGEVAGIVEECALARFEMDGIGHMIGAEENYNTAQDTISTLVDDAKIALQAVSDKLVQTKRNYEAADGYSQWLLDQG